MYVYVYIYIYTELSAYSSLLRGGDSRAEPIALHFSHTLLTQSVIMSELPYDLYESPQTAKLHARR